MRYLSLAAVVLALVSITADGSTETMTSPGIGPLNSQFSHMGGLIIDMVGTNGKRLTAQVPPAKLTSGWVPASMNFYAIWSQPGFDAYTLQTLLGGGLSKVNIRMTLQDGDSGSGNPVYATMFGPGNFPYKELGNGYSQPPNYDFDGGTDLYVAVRLADGSYINAGYMGLTTTYRLDTQGNTFQTFTGFPGVYALTDAKYASVPKPPTYMPPFAVTAWFSVPTSQLAALYQTLSSQTTMTIGIWDIDPGDQFYDFTQGTGSDVLDIPLLPAHVVSFTASPTAVFGAGSVTLSWQTQGATSVRFEPALPVDAGMVNGSVSVEVSTPSTFRLIASGPGGDGAAELTVAVMTPLTASTAALPNGIVGAPYSQALAATGGTTPYAWSIASGSLPPGLYLRTDGTITGTPTVAGTASILVQVIDSSNPAQTATQPLSLTITPGLTITTESFPNAVLGAPYNQIADAIGGTAPYLWSLASGALPPGLTLEPTGRITGTPTGTTTATFVLRVQDSTTPDAQATTRSFTLTVGSELSIQTMTLPPASVGNQYSHTLIAAGGTTPYTWSVDAGPLPEGLTLNPTTGVISGIPNTPGLTTLIVRATDRTAPTAQSSTRTLTLYVVHPLTIDTLTLPDGTASRSYAAALNVHDGIQPYLWSLTSGTIPPGLQLLASGALLGTPTTPGEYTFTLRVSDSSLPTGLFATHTYTVRINPAFTITTTSLPGGSTGIPYTATVHAVDGVAPYTYALIFGTFPPGLVLNPDGTIGGTPTAPGVFNLLIRATDSTLPAAQTSDRALVISIDSKLSIVTASLADGSVNLPYSQTLAAINGTQPYTWSIASGSLPPGLSLLQSGTLMGTPTTEGTYNFSIKATDATQPTPAISTRAYSVQIAQPLTLATDTLPNGLIDVPYTAVLTTIGGIQPYSYAHTSGELPPGLALNAIGVISGTPTTAGKYTVTLRVTDSGVTVASAERTYTIAVNEPLTVPTSTLPNAVNGSLYTHQLVAEGGLGPYVWSIASGSLPPGLTLLTPGVIIGTPTRNGNYDVELNVTDSTPGTPQTVTITTTLAVVAPLSLHTTTLRPVPPNVAHSDTLSATGGTQPYTWSIAAGSLPAGLTLAPTGILSGNTAATGSYPVTITVSDSAEPPQTVSREFVLLVASPFAIMTTSPMTPAVAGVSYSEPLSFSGGKTPITCGVDAGALPNGIALQSNGTLNGRATNLEEAQFVVRCEDATGQVSLKALTLTVQEPLTIVAETRPVVVANAPYYHLFRQAGGNGPFAWSISSGSLPDGLALSTNGLLSGTTNRTGTYVFTVRVNDSSVPQAQAATLPITINIALPLKAISQTFTAVVGATFRETLAVTGGVAPVKWSVAGGSLPPGITLDPSNGVLTGPALVSGSYQTVLVATDSIGQTSAAFIPFTVSDPISIPLPHLPDGTVGAPYAATLYASGGTAPYTWTLASGSLPTGLTLSVGGGITGVPTAAGTYTFEAAVNTGTELIKRSYSIMIAPAPASLTIPPSSAALAPATVGVLYHANLIVLGGQPPVSWTLASGSLPSGLALNPTGALSGTPSTAGTFSFSLTVSDTTKRTATASYVLTVAPAVAITTATLPTGNLGRAYATSLTATGGRAPYTWAAQSLPDGLALSKTGVISGTPLKAGQYSVSLAVTDSSATPIAASKTLTLIVSAGLVIAGSGPQPGTVGVPYTYSYSAQNGVAPYTWTLTNGLLPPGLTLSAAGTLTGTPTKAGNWSFLLQVTDATGQNISQQQFLTIRDALIITTSQVPSLPLSSPVSFTFAAQGGTPPYTWRIATGSLPTGIALTTTGTLTGTPTVKGSWAVMVEVSDGATLKADAPFTVIVSDATIPAVEITPDREALDPGVQYPVAVALAKRHSGDLTGTLTVAGNADQDLGFVQGGLAIRRSIRFRITANTTKASFTDGVPLLQAGTVASPITLTATLDGTNSVHAVAENRVLPTVPAITSARHEVRTGGFDVVLDGYSTTREVQSATFRFFGADAASPPTTMSTGPLFEAWYGSEASRGSGVFRYRQSFSLSGSPSTLSYIEVSLTNAVGTSVTHQISIPH